MTPVRVVLLPLALPIPTPLPPTFIVSAAHSAALVFGRHCGRSQMEPNRRSKQNSNHGRRDGQPTGQGGQTITLPTIPTSGVPYTFVHLAMRSTFSLRAVPRYLISSVRVSHSRCPHRRSRERHIRRQSHGASMARRSSAYRRWVHK